MNPLNPRALAFRLTLFLAIAVACAVYLTSDVLGSQFPNSPISVTVHLPETGGWRITRRSPTGECRWDRSRTWPSTPRA
jgi:hypothetical protein